MNTEWIIEPKCPQKEGSTLEETARSCAECPHKIPVLDAGITTNVCGVAVANLADDLDSIVYRITGIDNFRKQRFSPSERIRILLGLKNTQPKISGPLRAFLQVKPSMD